MLPSSFGIEEGKGKGRMSRDSSSVDVRHGKVFFSNGKYYIRVCIIIGLIQLNGKIGDQVREMPGEIEVPE